MCMGWLLYRLGWGQAEAAGSHRVGRLGSQDPWLQGKVWSRAALEGPARFPAPQPSALHLRT